MFLMIFQLSCSDHSEEKQSLNLLGEVSFPVGFVTGKIKPFIIEQNEYVTFADLTSRRLIKVFNTEGKEVSDIHLGDFIEKYGKISDFHLVSLDSIFLLTKYTNHIYLLNLETDEFIQKDYSRLLSDGIELSGPLNFVGNKVYCTIDYNPPFESEILNLDQFLEANEEILRRSILFVDTAPRKSEISYNVELDSVYLRFADPMMIYVEGNHILCTDEVIIFYSSYSDSLYIYTADYELARVVGVESEFSDAKVKPVSVKEFMSNNNLVSKNFLDNGFIQDIEYDPYRNIYYCIIRHPAPREHRPFSILVLSEDFSKLYESEMDEEKYNTGIFVGSKGLYLSTSSYENGLHTFHIFTYE